MDIPLASIRIHPILRPQLNHVYNEWVVELVPRAAISIERGQVPGPLGTVEYLNLDPRFLEFLRKRGLPFVEV